MANQPTVSCHPAFSCESFHSHLFLDFDRKRKGKRQGKREEEEGGGERKRNRKGAAGVRERAREKIWKGERSLPFILCLFFFRDWVPAECRDVAEGEGREA